MKKLFLLLTAFVLVMGLSACKTDPLECETGYSEVDGECVKDEDPANTNPAISGVSDVTLFIGNVFDELEGITASDAEDGDITSDIDVAGTVDLATAGTYTLTYTVTDSAGGVNSVTRKVVVEEADLVYPSGFFNYKFAQTDLRHTFMAAAEKYLMNNMYGGIPLYGDGGYSLYSSRLQLPVDEYVAVMGFGTRFATLSADDSTVKMYDGQLGTAGEYTYRTRNSEDPVTFNQWLYKGSTDATYMGEYYGALYDYVFNGDKTGYEVVPSMASGDPIPVNATITDTGKEVAKTWQIPLKSGLKWSYFGGTTPTGVTDNDITAEDYVDTFKLALDNSWFRAISGGGDFVTSANEIVGAEDYVDNAVFTDEAFANVGIKIVDGKIQFTFVDDQSDWNVRYWLSSFVMSPVHTELYEALKNSEGVSSYGTSPSSIAYHGPYVISEYETAIVLLMEKNPNYATPTLDFYTHKSFQIIKEATVAFATFEAGQLEGIGLPTEKFEQYKDYPGLKQVPGVTTWRLQYNGNGTVANQKAMFPDSAWIPEPLIANDNFKMAMFHGINRQYLAETVLKTRSSIMYYFSEAYLVDAELGVPYRLTEQGMTVSEGLSPSTYGYNFDAAVRYWEIAVEEEIAAGNYDAGTVDAWTTITLEFNYFADSSSQVTMFEYLEKAFETAFIDYANYVKVDLVGYAKAFPDIYTQYMMKGDFDLSLGGISGSTLDAASFLDVFADDNRGGFTLSWGGDTTTANINVIYNDFEGNRHNEMWSFNAIYSVLNGEVYVSEGAEAIVPAPKIDSQTPTSITFTVDQFDNDDFTNFTYTLNYWDGPADAYLPTDIVDVPVTTATVTLTGLNPYYDFGYPDYYFGDYQVVVNYAYTIDETKEGSSSSPDVYLDSTVADWVDAGTATTMDLTLELHEDFTSTITSVKLLDDTHTDTAIVVTVSGLQLTASGLTADTDYVLMITYADGTVQYEYYGHAIPAA